MLSSTSWAHLNTLLRGAERCLAVLSLVESNLKLVKLFAQHGSTFPLFRGHPCVAQQSRVHLRSNAQHVEPTRSAQRIHWEFKHIEHFTRWRRRSWKFYRIVQMKKILKEERQGYGRRKKGKSLLFYHVVFLTFCTHQWVRLLEVQPSIFVFWGDEYT